MMFLYLFKDYKLEINQIILDKVPFCFVIAKVLLTILYITLFFLPMCHFNSMRDFINIGDWRCLFNYLLKHIVGMSVNKHKN